MICRQNVEDERRRLGFGSWKELEVELKDCARKELTCGLMHHLEVQIVNLITLLLTTTTEASF